VPFMVPLPPRPSSVPPWLPFLFGFALDYKVNVVIVYKTRGPNSQDAAPTSADMNCRVTKRIPKMHRLLLILTDQSSCNAGIRCHAGMLLGIPPS